MPTSKSPIAKKKKKKGRPPKLSAEVQALFIQALSAGNYLHTSAAYAGISRDTLDRWLKAGRRSKKRPYQPARVENGKLIPEVKGCRYRAFSDAVEKAMAVAEVGHVGNILSAAKGRPGQPAQREVVDERGNVIQPAKAAVSELRPEWTASAWWLERTQPQKWGRKLFRIEDANGGGDGNLGPPGPVIYIPAEIPLPDAPEPAQLGEGQDRDSAEADAEPGSER